MSESGPAVSVIIATYNRRRMLERTVPLLFAQDLAPDQYEVVVVVDGSTDDTVRFLGRYRSSARLHVVEQKHNRGQGPAWNLGVQAASGRVVLFMDDDILCSPQLVRAHIEAHAA